jgi:hypothetical protein
VKELEREQAGHESVRKVLEERASTHSHLLSRSKSKNEKDVIIVTSLENMNAHLHKLRNHMLQYFPADNNDVGY